MRATCLEVGSGVVLLAGVFFAAWRFMVTGRSGRYFGIGGACSRHAPSGHERRSGSAACFASGEGCKRARAGCILNPSDGNALGKIEDLFFLS